MSFNFFIRNNTEFTYTQLISNHYVPKDTKLQATNPDSLVDGYSKLYLPKSSSRGVALRVSPKEYNIEINIGATKEDYLLAVKLSMAIAELNNSLIATEGKTEELNLNQLEEEFNADWAESSRHLGIESSIDLLNQTNSTSIALHGCIRPYYLGPYVIEKLNSGNPTREVFYDKLIEEIRHLQFIEDDDAQIKFPSVRIMDFPNEPDKKIAVIVPGYKLLIPVVDYLFLNKPNEMMAKVPHLDFIEYMNNKLKRIDELHYITEPISDDTFTEIISYFNSKEKENNQIIKQERQKYEPIEISKKPWWKIW